MYLQNIMSQRFQAVKGMRDILPDDQKYWSFLTKVVRHRARQAGYKRISTPILEDYNLCSRSVGTDSDIVKKEMFVVERPSQRLVMRPECTASVVRSYIEHGMFSLPQPIELYYIEPMFRAEKPQKGRYRQFYQYGFEVLGESDPALDAQLVYLAYQVLKDCSISENMVVQINSIGDFEDRKKYKQALLDYFTGKERNLTEISLERLKTNPLRILDTKDEDEKILVNLAPKFAEYLSDEAKEYHKLFKEYLDELKVPYIENPYLVRGLDYYNRTVFEITDRENTSFAYAAGGRYDHLAKLLGGPDTPAVGFSAGMDRIVEVMQEKMIDVEDKDELQVFVAQIGPKAKKRSLSILVEIRNLGIKAIGSMGKSSISSQMKAADKFNAPWCVLLGDQEVYDNQVIIKNMKTGSQDRVPQDQFLEELVKRIGVENIQHYQGPSM